MNRVLMFFKVLKSFLLVDSCFPKRIFICFVGLLLEPDCVLRIFEKEQDHIILLIAVYSSM